MQAQLPQRTHELHGHVRPAVASGQARRLEDLASDQRLNVSIQLAPRNQAELSELLTQVYDPNSPDYRHYLSVAEFTDRFGPTAENYQAAIDFAEAHGLTVTRTFANRMVVPLSGTVSQIEAAFHVRLATYQHPTEARTFYSTDREPSVDLDIPVAHIAGLDNYSIPKPQVLRSSATRGLATMPQTGSGPGGAYMGSDMRAAYYGNGPLTGVGQTVGLLEFDGYNQSDVDLTFSNAGQTYSVPINNVLLDGATGASCQFEGAGCDDAEEVLDIVQAISMAPGLSQVLVYVGSSDADLLNTIASEDKANEVSISWGWTPDDPQTDDVFFREMAVQGQSVFAASGDYGAFDASISPYFYPGEDMYVTTVGGTHLNTNGAGGSWASETAWEQSGGGISPDGTPIPSWQNGIANSSNQGSTMYRNVPDVGMEADFDNYTCYMGTCGSDWGGTSFATPRWAAYLALANEQAAEEGDAAFGFLNPLLYPLAEGAHYTSNFHDIVNGNNDYDGPSAWFSAVTGYDLVTGWGSPNGQNLINTLAPLTAPGFMLAAAPSSIFISPGAAGSTTVSIYAADGFNGSVHLSITGLPAGVTGGWSVNPATSSSSLTLSVSSAVALGTYSLKVTGTSGALTRSTTFTLNVAYPSFTLSTSPNTYTLAQGASSSGELYIADIDGFSGAVTLGASGLPSGVTVSFGSNPCSGNSTPITIVASSSATPGTSTVTMTGTSGSTTATTTIAVTVTAPSFTLSSPRNVYLIPGGTAKSFVVVNAFNGFSGSVSLSASGLPNGVTGSFNPATTTGTSELTLSASSSAALGPSTVTITGQSKNLTSTAQVALRVMGLTDTATALTMTSGANPVTTVARGTAVTLTAVVRAGATPLTAGQVEFCDAMAAHCEDVHILGTAQLTSAGTATVKLVPGLGSHSYKAVYLGTAYAAQSISNTTGLVVTGFFSTETTIAASGSAGDYTLTATVNGQVNSTKAAAPSGTVSFLDTDNGDAVLGTATLTAGTGPVLSFVNSSTPATDPYPQYPAVADFNGDGKLDLVVPVYSIFTQRSAVDVFLGNGDGTFTPAPAVPATGYNANFAVVGDFNGDGKLDMALTLADANNGVLVLLGNGNGTFNPMPPIAISNDVWNIAAGDFNRDGNMDLVVTHPEGVSILLGNGDGTFTELPEIVTGGFAMSVAVGDFNGDGIPDLAVADDNGSVALLLGNGDGTFTGSSQSLTAGNNPTSIAAGDFNGDGKLDLAVANSDVTGSQQGTVSVFLGKGDGTFTPTPSRPSTGKLPYSVAVGDFNGDGIPDLVTSNVADNTVTILVGKGDGSFTALQDTASGTGTLSAAVGDFNGSGLFGVAVADNSTNAMAVLLPELLSTASATATGISIAGQLQHAVDGTYSGDPNYLSSVSSTVSLNPELTPTITVTPASSRITTVQSDHVTVTVSGGSGNPTPTGSVTLSSGTYTSGASTLTAGSVVINVPAGQLAVGSDTLTATYSGDTNYNSNTGTAPVTVVQAIGSCTTANPNPNPNPASFAAVEDFNGDCRSDILWRNNSTEQVYEWFMNGTTYPGSGTPGSPTSDWVIQNVGDFNGDGMADILWRNSTTGEVYIWLMNGSTMTSAGSLGFVSSDWSIAGVGDFNGDGKADILWWNSTTGQVYIWLMNGTTMAGGGSASYVSAGWSIQGIGDFNGDGKADILWRNNTTGETYIWLMNGSTLASSGSLGYVSSDWTIAGIGDFDGDGKSDILWRNSSTGQVYIWFINGTATASTGSVGYVTTDWKIQGVGDYNGDGKADILWRNSTSEQVFIWLMSGATLTSSGTPGTPAAAWQIAPVPTAHL